MQIKCKIDKKLSCRKETVRLHYITSSSAVAEKKHCRVGQFWVGGGLVSDIHMKVSIHTANHIDTRLAVARVRIGRGLGLGLAC